MESILLGTLLISSLKVMRRGNEQGDSKCDFGTKLGDYVCRSHEKTRDGVGICTADEHPNIGALWKTVNELLSGKLEMNKTIQHLQKVEAERNEREFDMQEKFKEL